MNGGQLHFCNGNDGDDGDDDNDVEDDDDDNDDDENDGWWTFAFVHSQRQWPKLHKPHFSPFTPSPT